MDLPPSGIQKRKIPVRNGPDLGDKVNNEHLFFSMGYARAVIADWVTDYNTRRPHSAIGYQTPAAYAAALNTQRPSALCSMEGSAPMAVAHVAHMRNAQLGIPVADGRATGVRSTGRQDFKGVISVIQNVCPVCETHGSKPKCSVREQDYVACLTCGHTFLSTLPESGALAKFYQNRESHHVRREKIDWDYSELKYRRFYRPLLDRIGAVVSGRRLLDVGTGNGAFLAAAERMGWEARGLELEAGSLEIARARGLTVSDCKLSQGDFANDSIDAVTSWQVIEHVDDFSEYLGEIRRILAPGGVVALSTPNVQSIGWRLLGPRWQAVEPEVHMHLFTPHSMDRLLRRYGFSRVSLCTADIKPATFRRAVQRRRGNGPTQQRFSEFAASAGTGRMEAMFTVLALMNPILRATGLGEDIYAIYRKSA